MLSTRHWKDKESAKIKTKKYPKTDARLSKRFIKPKHCLHLKDRPIVCLYESESKAPTFRSYGYVGKGLSRFIWM